MFIWCNRRVRKMFKNVSKMGASEVKTNWKERDKVHYVEYLGSYKCNNFTRLIKCSFCSQLIISTQQKLFPWAKIAYAQFQLNASINKIRINQLSCRYRINNSTRRAVSQNQNKFQALHFSWYITVNCFHFEECINPQNFSYFIY